MTAASNPAEYSLLFDQPRIYNSLDIWVKKLNYIRLQNIRLAYQIPSKLLNRININGATVAVEARNLLYSVPATRIIWTLNQWEICMQLPLQISDIQFKPKLLKKNKHD